MARGCSSAFILLSRIIKNGLNVTARQDRTMGPHNS